jgi:hypothetical protein
MKYTVEMGSDSMKTIPSFIKIGLGRFTDTQRTWRLLKPTFIFFSKLRE